MNGEEDLSPYSKQVAKGSFWGLAGNVFFKLISFFYMILLARLASQDDVGLFFLAWSIAGLVCLVSDLGLPGSLARYVPYFEARKESGKIKYILKTGAILVAVVSFLAAILLFWQADMIGEFYNNSLLPEAIRILSVYVILYNFFKFVTQYLRSRADIKSMQVVQNTANIAKLVLTALFFYLYGASFLTIAVPFLLSELIAIIVSLPLIRRRTADLPVSTSPISKRELLMEIVPFGLMITISATFSKITGSFDKIILGYLLPSDTALELVGVYGMATTLSLVLIVFPGAIGAIFLPVMSKLAGKKDFVQMRAVTETAQRWSLFIVIPIALLMISFAGSILGVLYGASYSVGAIAMAIFTIGVMFRCFAIMFSLTLAAMRRIEVEIAIAIFVSFMNVGFNILLIPSMGMEGAAIASAISLFIMALLLFYFMKKFIGFRMPAEIYKMFAAGLLAFMIMLLIRPVLSSALDYFPDFGDDGIYLYLSKAVYLVYLTLMMAVSVLLFGTFSLVLKCFKKEDIILMKKAMRRAMVPDLIIMLAEDIASKGVQEQK